MQEELEINTNKRKKKNVHQLSPLRASQSVGNGEIIEEWEKDKINAQANKYKLKQETAYVRPESKLDLYL
jgi:hypothetical protein